MRSKEELLRQSGLDWVIARPVALKYKPHLGKLVVEYIQTPTPFAISRQQLARFMVDSLRGDTIYIKPHY